MRNHKMRNRLPDVERRKIIELSHKELLSEEGKEALSYLKYERKITDKVIEDFQIGYVPNWVTNFYDDKHEFSGRLIFPIIDQYKEPIALSSRDWRKSANMKFFHETYRKRNYFYGLDVAKNSIIKNNKAIIVEGEFDVLQSHSYGIDCTVGMLGSSLHLEQISMLSRYCENLYLVFDDDAAGKECLKKSLEMSSKLKFSGAFLINMIPVKLTNGKDPDEFLKNNGKNEYIKLLQKSKQDYENINWKEFNG